MSVKLLALYFVVGGVIVAAVTYFGSQGKGLLAAFVAFFPSVTVVTLVSIYLASGVSATVSYFRGMLLLLPAWALYATAMLFMLPRWGLVPSVVAGVCLYIAAAWVTMRIVR
jgi:hypothetical protein